MVHIFTHCILCIRHCARLSPCITSSCPPHSHARWALALTILFYRWAAWDFPRMSIPQLMPKPEFGFKVLTHRAQCIESYKQRHRDSSLPKKMSNWGMRPWAQSPALQKSTVNTQGLNTLKVYDEMISWYVCACCPVSGLQSFCGPWDPRSRTIHRVTEINGWLDTTAIKGHVGGVKAFVLWNLVTVRPWLYSGLLYSYSPQIEAFPPWREKLWSGCRWTIRDLACPLNKNFIT